MARLARRDVPTNASARASDALSLLALSAVSLAALVALYLVAVQTGIGQRIDNAPLGSLNPELNPVVFDTTEDLLHTIDVSSLAILGAGIALLALLRGRLAAAASALALVVGANVTTQILKASLERPELTAPTPEGSFPSGHATVAMSLALALILVASPETRPLAAALGGGYAAAVGVAVVLLDWHRPSDVIGAYLVCCIWFGIAATVSRSLRRRPARSGIGGWGIALAGAVTAAFATVSIWTVSGRIDLFQVVGGRIEFVLTAVAIVLAAGCVVGLAAWLLREPPRLLRDPNHSQSGRPRVRAPALR